MRGLIEMKTGRLLVVTAAACLATLGASAQYVRETLTLDRGWNAVYIESTPDEADCAAFFADLPVTRVGAYQPTVSPRQIDDSGREILQQPLSYLTWVKGETEANTLLAITGGRCYLIYATAAATKTFLGIPSAPQTSWRAADVSGNGLLNIAGASLAAGTESVTARKYFGEGPYGASGGTINGVSGTDEALPTFTDLGLFGTAKVKSGRAYALTAKDDGEWSGVISLPNGEGVTVATGENYGSLTVANAGTAERTFRFRLVPSARAGDVFPKLSRTLPRTGILSDPGQTDVVANASWDMTLAAGAEEKLTFAADRTAMKDASVNYGAVLEIEDLGDTRMRVRTPVLVETAEGDAADNGMSGLWMGIVALTNVSQLADAAATPVAAAGVMKTTVLMLVDNNKNAKLLQRVAVGAYSNDTTRLYGELADVPKAVDGSPLVRKFRLTSVMMSVTVPEVAAGGIYSNVTESATNVVQLTTKFGDADGVGFLWTVAPDARDNPFRHALHPDHDGLRADYAAKLPTGDDFNNYSNPIKPELWSVVNALTFRWPKGFAPNADEMTEGSVEWVVKGLMSDVQIKSTGCFALKRILKETTIQRK